MQLEIVCSEVFNDRSVCCN